MKPHSAVEVRASGLTCAVGGRDVVTDVDFCVPSGARLAIVGPNGAGKTTLLRTLAGIARPARGSVAFDGVDVASMRTRRRALSVAYVGQEDQPSGDLTVTEAVGLGRTPHRGPWSVTDRSDRSIIDDALTSVGMLAYADRACTDLSGGERHRVTIARALAQCVPALVLDEPTNHLDAAWRLRLMDLIDSLPCTVVAAVHDLDLVLRHFDLVAVVCDGTLRSFGAPVEVLSPELVHDVFAVRGDVVGHPVTDLPHLLLTEATPFAASLPKESP
ncbi:ABC transporter ATP-binding protein [Gordonia sp. HY285]|uniref:ABC transporter ATP-binding protein n=1 Tax=Gordonia liuliyuniae TaxID=2911517 RepID=UPI001F32A1BA|nr:ABC transporter ATP-binding protein [Gordonia liuliyuniae]MCF8608810.1 ABC transporter ATP-binding protein [Gordonia liuliyuniae]